MEMSIHDDLMLIRLGERFDISAYREFSEVISTQLQKNIHRCFLDFGPTKHFDSSSVPMLFYLRHKAENKEVTLVNFNEAILKDINSQDFKRFFRILDRGTKELKVQWWQDVALITPSHYFNQTVKANFLSICEQNQSVAVKHYFIDFINTKWYDDESVHMLFQFRSKLKRQETITLVDFKVVLLQDLNIDEFRMFFRLVKRNQTSSGAMTEKNLRSAIESESLGQQSELSSLQLD